MSRGARGVSFGGLDGTFYFTHLSHILSHTLFLIFFFPFNVLYLFYPFPGQGA